MLVITIIITIIFLVWLGLRIKPHPFPGFSKSHLQPDTIPLPGGLPAAVERFYRSTYGNTIPIIKTAVINGRETIKLFGITFPIRFRFTHEAGYSFRSDIDITFCGIRVMKGTERFVDGIGKGNTPAGVDEGEWFNQSANIRMWVEALENTASLIIPYGNKQERIIVRFNSKTGKADFVEAMKYKNATTKMLWINGIWMDDAKPWIRLDVEEILYNADVNRDLMKEL